jgi:Ca2+-binding EF-hand superfamily protein
MDITNFGNMVKRIDKDLKDDEIKAAFDKFDSLKTGYITF